MKHYNWRYSRWEDKQSLCIYSIWLAITRLCFRDLSVIDENAFIAPGAVVYCILGSITSDASWT